MSPEHKEQTAALEQLQKADAKVTRKETKLVLTTGAVAAATTNMVKASGELREAKKEQIKAKESFCEVVGCVFEKALPVPPDKTVKLKNDKPMTVSMRDYFNKHSRFGDANTTATDDFG